MCILTRLGANFFVLIQKKLNAFLKNVLLFLFLFVTLSVPILIMRFETNEIVMYYLSPDNYA